MIFTPIMIIMAVLFIVFVVLMIVLVRKKKTGWVWLLLALAIGAAAYGYKEYNRGHTDMARAKADIQIKATALIADYTSNDSLADKKYLGKIIEVEGNVKKIEKDETGFYTVVLGDTTGTASVRCSMDTVHQQDAAALTAGSSAIVRGACTGFKKNQIEGIDLGSDVELNRCAIIKKNK